MRPLQTIMNTMSDAPGDLIDIINKLVSMGSNADIKQNEVARWACCMVSYDNFDRNRLTKTRLGEGALGRGPPSKGLGITLQPPSPGPIWNHKAYKNMAFETNKQYIRKWDNLIACEIVSNTSKIMLRNLLIATTPPQNAFQQYKEIVVLTADMSTGSLRTY